MRKFLALAACCAAVSVPVALASEGNDTQQPEPVTNPCDQVSGADGRAVLKRAWHRSGWRHRNPVKLSQSRALDEVWGCLEGKPRKKLRAYAQNLKDHFALYRRYRQVTPFAGYQGRGKWLTHLAVPRYIVDCESHGSWFAYNSSGASYLYQLLGWGAPYPSSPEAKVRNHEIAHAVSSGSRNFSPWVCA